MKLIESANHVQIIPCDCDEGCGTIRIWLFDDDGKPYAVAAFDRKGILGLANDLVETVDRVDADCGDGINA